MTSVLDVFRAIAASDERRVAQYIDMTPRLAIDAIDVGATRQRSTAYFLETIGHYVYAGDTALHIAAATYSPGVAKMLIDRGADVRARNRRGAEPLHYAADGNPTSQRWNPESQAATITALIRGGADADAVNMDGVTALHRAVRTRCASAVEALLDGGADPRRKNGHGSTPLQLAERTTGRGGSGSEPAREQQRRIIEILRARGA